MRLIKRDLFLFASATALVILCALAWGSPFVGTNTNLPAQAQQRQGSTGAQARVFEGTILRHGQQFVLRDASGQILRLDDAQHAQPYESKLVRVTGKLDARAKLIHVQHIDFPMV